MSEIKNNTIIKYYYDFIVQSSLTSLVFPKKDGNINKNELQDMNYFILKHKENDKKVYKDNLCYLTKHINSLQDNEVEKYKIIYFPFVNEFIEVSKNREDKILSTPTYFIFSIDKSFKKTFIELKNLSIFHKEKYLKSIFKNAQIVFNNYYASNKLYIINHSDLHDFKEELEDKEIEKKYPNKNFDYYISILNKYIDASNIKKEDKKYFVEILENFNEKLKSKINNNTNLNTVIENDTSSLIGVVNIEKLLEQDNIVKGLLSAYKSSIIPHFKKNKVDDKLNRILYYHPSQYFNDISIKKSNKNTLSLSEENIKTLQKNHLGSFSSKFAITLSQRLSLSAYLSPMDIIPVNGPPGTGKTALLRAIFADYIVKEAIKAKSSYDNVKKDPYSFIDTGKPILGTSSVKQAINNIIEGISDGFSDAKKSNKVLYKRWLKLKDFEADVKIDLVEENCVVPQIRNSENKYENKILFTSINKIFDYISSLDIKLAEREYLNNINLISKKDIKNLDDAVDFLFINIKILVQEIDKKIEVSDDLLCTYDDLDKNERFDTFFISLHLLEAFFILNLKRLNKKSSNGKCPLCNGSIESNNYVFQCESCDFIIYKEDKFNDISITKFEDLKALLDNSLEQNDKFYGIKYYEGGYKIVEKDESGSDLSSDINNIYLITPLFPMITVTMHSLYGAFKKKENDEYVLIREFFDLVLSDESGMILAPIALPALFISKKMVIVGDEKQIEPVYPFDEIVDKSIIDNISPNIDYSKFKKDHSSIFSNFLTVANRSTYFDSFEMKEHEENSLWLKEHFRCKDEIIEYCNEIIYKGILIPKVRFNKKTLYLDGAEDFYPSMKLFNLESTVKNNSSFLEATEIAKFLIENICNLTHLYNNSNETNLLPEEFHKYIGIVTPFNNQKKMIMQALKKTGQYNLDKILVGTVHAFQGSEREIILFSPSVDKKYNGIHFTNNDDGNMMNVAVSRAKSAFWIFGSKQGLKNCGEYTKKLVDYIDEHYECALRCPKCNDCIIDDVKAFKCENYSWDYKTKKVDGCSFIIWKSNKSTGCDIAKKDLISLLTDDVTYLNGKEFVLDIKNKFFIREKEVKQNLKTVESLCPKCGKELIIRVAGKGENKGNKFYGCSNFPKCRYTEKII